MIPELKGKFDGYALRVPTPTVSIVDFVAEVEKPTSVEELNAAFQGRFRNWPHEVGILGYSEETPRFHGLQGRFSLFNHRLTGCTMVMGGNMVKVVTWYDNEWGYSCRTGDLAAMMAKSL